MKHLLFSGFLLFTSLGFAQHGIEIEYEEVSIPRIIGKDGKEEKLSGDFLAALSVPKNYVLQIKNNQSVFTKLDKVNNSQSENTVIMLGVIPYNILIDFNQNLKKQEWLIEHKKFIVTDTISSPFKYELTQEKATYLGFSVKQAIIKYDEDNKIIIWYAPDLPKRFGPKEYINLPGLVLKIEGFQKGKTEPSYYMKATSVITKDNLEFKKLFKAKEITKQDFKKLEIEYEKNNENQHQGVDTQ